MISILLLYMTKRRAAEPDGQKKSFKGTHSGGRGVVVFFKSSIHDQTRPMVFPISLSQLAARSKPLLAVWKSTIAW